MIAFIDEHRASYGVEPICRELPIAPSTYHAEIARRADPSKAPPRVRRDVALRGEVRRVWEEKFGVRRAQGLASARPRGRQRRALHRRPSDAPDGPAGDGSGKISENHDQRQGDALSPRPGEPGLQGTGAQQALGVRLHLRCHLERLRLRRLRDRRIRQKDRGLERRGAGTKRERPEFAWRTNGKLDFDSFATQGFRRNPAASREKDRMKSRVRGTPPNHPKSIGSENIGTERTISAVRQRRSGEPPGYNPRKQRQISAEGNERRAGCIERLAEERELGSSILWGVSS